MRQLFILYIVVLLSYSSGVELENGPLHFVNWSGTSAFRENDFERALNEILQDTLVVDTSWRYLKLGLVHSKLGNYSKALFLLRLAANKNGVVKPLAYEYIGNIEIELERPENALHAFRTALGSDIPLRYKRHLFEKIREVLAKDTAKLITDAPWLDDYYRWFSSRKRTDTISVIAQFDSLIAQKKWAHIDTLLRDVKGNLDAGEKCAIIRKITKSGCPESVFSTKMLFSIAEMARACKQSSNAYKWLRAAEKRSDFTKIISKHDALYFSAFLHYDLGKYKQASQLLEKYNKEYGPKPYVMLTLARAYRSLGNTKASTKWYDEHVRVFPHHSKTVEIIWYRAWQFEEWGNLNKASEYYKRIYTTYTKDSRAIESMLRHGLCYYRKGQYDSASTVLEEMVRRFRNTHYRPAASFWLGKCYLKMKNKVKAKSVFSEIAKDEPTEYYSHRSRQLLEELGDTIEVLTVDTLIDIPKARHWLDSISPSSKKRLSKDDSLKFNRGMLLALLGATEESDYFLEPLELSFPGNLTLQFDLAFIFQISNAPAQAYRVARRLAWRIPSQHRKNLPLPVYSLLFPSFFENIIGKEAIDRDVDPFLVSAVIRQESIFNPKIVSSAGAIGLMQLMPYTAKTIAGQLGEPFVQDSLYFPFTNIRYGTFYIRELLDKFSDNIVLVLAGYNGGPHNAKKWHDRNKDKEFDLFIEDIGYTETRGYVKKVMANYWTYKALSNFQKSTAE